MDVPLLVLLIFVKTAKYLFRDSNVQRHKTLKKKTRGLGKGCRLLLDMLWKVTFTSNLGFEGFNLGRESRHFFFPFQQLLHCF